MPDRVPPDKSRIAALIQQGRFSEARALCETACALHTNDAELWFLLGNISAREGNHGRAVECYRKVISLMPNIPQAHYNLGCAFNQLGRPVEAIESFRKATQLKPDFAEALDTMGVTLLKLDQQTEGIHAIREAVRANPDYRMARNNLDKAYEKLVPRWHFPMMNDEARNEAYNRALQKVITPDSVVLDIGTGSGLLSMMAIRAGAKHVYTCEAEQIIAEKAKEIIALNGMADRITVIPKMSTSVQVGVDMPEQADVLVSEIVDVGLLAEGVVSSTQHARALLIKPGAPILPCGAVVYAALIESEQIHQDNHVATANGFDVSPFNEFSSIIYQQKRIDNYRHVLLSEPFEIFSFDFAGASITPAQREICVQVSRNGTFHAIVMWFHLYLDNEIFINTWPEQNDSCWMQAVQTMPEAVTIKASHTVTVSAEHDCKVIRLAAGQPGLAR